MPFSSLLRSAFFAIRLCTSIAGLHAIAHAAALIRTCIVVKIDDAAQEAISYSSVAASSDDEMTITDLKSSLMSMFPSSDSFEDDSDDYESEDDVTLVDIASPDLSILDVISGDKINKPVLKASPQPSSPIITSPALAFTTLEGRSAEVFDHISKEEASGLDNPYEDREVSRRFSAGVTEESELAAIAMWIEKMSAQKSVISSPTPTTSSTSSTSTRSSKTASWFSYTSSSTATTVQKKKTHRRSHAIMEGDHLWFSVDLGSRLSSLKVIGQAVVSQKEVGRKFTWVRLFGRS